MEVHDDFAFHSDDGMVDVGTLGAEHNSGDRGCDYIVVADEDKCNDDEYGTLQQGEDVVVEKNIGYQEDKCNKDGFDCSGSTLSDERHVASE